MNTQERLAVDISPLHEDKPLPKEFVAKAKRTWADACRLANQMLDDSTPEYAGSQWNTAHLWVNAQELAASDPVLGAALLLILSEQDKLLVGPTPEATKNAQPRLKVRLTSFPESNGKTNWTALLTREENWDGLVGSCGGMVIERGELWNRVAYEAERAKFLLGERDTEPFILDYGYDIRTPEEWKGETHGRKGTS